jgi:hypothetical protein
MREMTTAEFAKANLAALEEPVSVRRYTKVVGTYYPSSFSPAPVEAINLALDAGLAEANSQKRVDALEDEIKRLKKLLAARQPAVTMTTALGRADIPRNAFDDLAKQDREFFERKLGKKK